MSSNETMKNKLVNSMKMTKQGTAKTTTASEKKEEPVTKKASAPAKPAPQSANKAADPSRFSSGSGCRVWPD